MLDWNVFSHSNHKHDASNITEWWMVKKPTTTATGQKWEFAQWNDIILLRTLNQMWSREHEFCWTYMQA